MKTSFLLKQTVFAAVFVTCVTLVHALKFEIPDELKDEAQAQEAAEKAALEEQLEQSEAQATQGDGRMSFGTGDNEPSDGDAEATTDGSGELTEAGEDNAPGDEPEVFAEGEGRIAGQIFDKDTGQPLRGVAIVIDGSDIGTITDSQGRYRLNKVPTGEYTLSFIKSGYIEATVTETQVIAGELLKLDFAMPPRPAEMSDEVYVLQGITVTAAEAISQNVALLSLRQTSIASIDALSSEDFAKFAASDIAEAVTKVSGASLSDGKYLVFRGLNDRYNTILINGVQLPSPDPDRKAIALDIFPTSLFESVIARKTYTSNMPGESSGGSVELNTKSVPEEPFVKFSFGVGMQEQTTGKEFLSDPERVDYLDWLSGDDIRGFNNLPGGTTLLSDYSNTVGGLNIPITAPVLRQAGYDGSFSFSTGASKEFNDWLTLGAVFGIKTSFKTRSKITEFDETNFDDGLRLVDEFGVTYTGSEEYDAAMLFGLGAQLGESTNLYYNYLRSDTISTEAAVKDLEKVDEQVSPEEPIRFLDSEILTEDRFLQAHQFGGEFSFNTGADDDWKLNWYYTKANMGQSEPDQRVIDDLRVGDPESGILSYLDEESGTTYFFPGSNNRERKRVLRFNRETEQDSNMMGATVSSPSFDLWEHAVLSFELGGARVESEREFVQLETEINNEFIVTNPLYAALPVPNGGGLSSLFTSNEYFDNIFFEQFVDDFEVDAESDTGGVNGLIVDLFDQQLSVLPGEVANAQTQVDSRTTTLGDLETQLIAQQATLDLLLGFLPPDNPVVVAQQQTVDALQDDVNTASAFLDAALTDLAVQQGRLDSITDERAAYIEDANAFISQIASMPALNMDASAFPSYNYFGGDNYILETPIGFTLYADETPSAASNQFQNVLNKYVAKGEDEVSSFFISGDLKLWDRFRLAGGLRRESTRLNYSLIDGVDGEPPAQTGALGDQFNPFVIEESSIDQSDNLPYLSFIFDITDDVKFQASWSRTVAKPTFREIAPFPIFNLTDGSIEFGNPGLTVINRGILDLGEPLEDEDYVVSPDFAGLNIADVESRDLRLEWYTPLDGLFSVGYFFKTVGSPIERVQALQINGIDINTFINNNNDADLRGFEIEMQQNLSVLNDFFDMDVEVLNWITIGGNYTDINATIERSSFEKGNLTNTDDGFAGALLDPNVFQSGELSERPLYNQPSFVANGFLTLDIEPTGTKITFSQNWVGEQLSKAGGLTGGSGTADFFWEEFSAINLVIEQRLSDHWKIQFTAKNINSPTRKLVEDQSWNDYLADGSRFLYDPGTSDPSDPDYQAALAGGGAFRTKTVVEPSYTISIKGSF